MAVTSNYSFPVPVATDLVTNGWDAINDLGVAVDTAMNTALGTKKAGMVLLSTASFSAVSSVSLPTNTFNSTYDNYSIICSFLGSVDSSNMRARLRASGTDNSTASSYLRQRLYFFSTSSSPSTATDTFWDSGVIQTTIGSYVVELFDPFLASATAFNSRSGSKDQMLNATGYHTQTVSYDSFSFFPSSGTITGKYSVYGYNK
jgi:hypothetical protein